MPAFALSSDASLMRQVKTAFLAALACLLLLPTSTASPVAYTDLQAFAAPPVLAPDLSADTYYHGLHARDEMWRRSECMIEPRYLPSSHHSVV
jgi:hypothetical protein